ncbi:MAG: UDP-N-acetylmuramyl-tripeptide synthetase [Sandaracinaceae bacterium]|nr:UDP-N-acetylmuramyl-tripeptide synthetase [Sandaracinaceae bacterium]
MTAPPKDNAAALARARPRLRSVGVTGTNGKTTTTSMVASIVAAAGEVAARATTLGTWVGDRQTSDQVTLDAFRTLVDEAVERGVRTLAVETTSHSLAGGFARVWPVDVAVFTNLTRDHLNVHGSPEAYLAAKAQLFMAVPRGGAVVWNLADPCSVLMDGLVSSEVTRLGYVVGDVHPDCAALPVSLRATQVQSGLEGTRFEVQADEAHQLLAGAFQLGAIGAVHVHNALAAALATAALGYAPDAIRAGLASFRGVPGRFEVLAAHPTVVVDYAHTPDALERTLAEARALVGADGRLTCVFGCGGGRDEGKRPEMGRVADGIADDVVLTDDNPRREDPARILDAIEAGVPAGERDARWVRIPDRRAAIRHAVERARPDDVVVIAGKGHEQVQLLASGPVAFSDHEVAREALRDAGVESPSRRYSPPRKGNDE